MTDDRQQTMSRRDMVKLTGVGALASTAGLKLAVPRRAEAGHLQTRALFFDVGGTILDWSVMPDKMEAYLAERGVTVDGQDFWLSWRTKMFFYMMYNTMIDSGFVPLEELATRSTLALAQSMGLDLDREGARGLYPLLGELDVYPDIEPGLEALREQGYKLVPHTQLSEPVLRKALLGRFDWDWYFTSETFAMYKPNRAIYLNALDAMGLDVAEVVYVSSNQFDVFAAKGVGFRTAWIDRWDQELEPYGYTPDWHVNDFVELAETLEAELP